MADNTNKRQIGRRYEQAAADYLSSRGLRILERNYRCRSGEIDLIASDGPYLVFVEVKYRSSAGKGAPAEAVHARKQQRIRQVARHYLYSHHYGTDTPCRFDVVCILAQQVQWIRNAF